MPVFALCLLFYLAIFAPSVPAAEPPIKIGVASMITPVDAVKYYQSIIDYIGEQIHRPVQMVHRRTYEEMDSLLEQGEVNVAFICSAPYVKNREKFGIELLAAPSVNGRAIYHSYVLVHKDSPLKSFADLKGKVFAFTDPKSNTGKLYPTYLLRTMSSTPEQYFKRHMYSYSHNKSIELVAKRVVDGAAVESLVYEYMIKTGSPYARQTRIIKRSPPYGTPPVVVTKDVNPVLRDRIRDAFLTMHKSEKGKVILDAMMIDGFVRIADTAYDPIRKMERVVDEDAVVSRKTRGRQTINFGVIPRDNPRILFEKYQPLLDYLAANTPYTYELVLKKNYEDTVNAIGNGEVDVALLGPLTYLEARTKYGAISILKPKGANGDARYRSVIITKKGSAFKQLSELKGKSVAFSASKSTSGNLIPRYLLANSGLHLSDLGRYANFDYHDSVVKAVLKGQQDAGAVRDSVARKYSKLGIDIIAESEPIPTGPLVAGPGTPYAAIESIKRALLALNPDDVEHKKILQRLDEDLKSGFMDAADADYADIRAKINAVPRTCGLGCHPKIQL
ncbi:MAG TPA: phosphate/phosphite/phosphonate ABC transporter substrate-binding protein [Nitrospirota bacterium]|nr:phosphate/phosphite/phosphonate ABC transporter substrate-binding protein [Nitrospirota bacterium]